MHMVASQEQKEDLCQGEEEKGDQGETDTQNLPSSAMPQHPTDLSYGLTLAVWPWQATDLSECHP
jgi:hypothetical protein